ncbi:DUF4838 domain-containing protein [Streptomyces sp. NBC_00341]|uniref:DUF4838 domain-containing protein n=1 Tax=Streptomyces sp. NBC_00341 TaxID=2975717 RepID=UPI00308697DE|nr:DUF4838 domain-containing protein [Streptomyces sp. NBC_00341]
MNGSTHTDGLTTSSAMRRRGFLAGAAGLAGAALLPAATAGRAAADTGASGAASGEPLRVVSGGRARATVLWWGAGSAEFAATELRDYIRRMTGVRLPLRAAPDPGSSAPEGVTGLVALRAGTGGAGPIAAGRLADAGRELDGAPEDSFTLLGDDTLLLLTGHGDRAPLYAVYALLERTGVRFFAPGFPAYEGHHERIPNARGLDVPAVRLTDRPGSELRRQYAEEGFSHTAASLPPLLDWMAKNRLNTFVYPTDYLGLGVTTYDGVRDVLVREAAKRSIRIETGGHGYDSFLPRADYPQFYESGGPVFDIYNPEALDAYVAKVVAFLRERPEITLFDCWPPDVGAFQKPVLDRYGTASDAESVVVNELARVLREELPGVRVERIAYASTVQPPGPQYPCDPEVVVDFAPYGRNYDGHLGDPAVGANTGLANALRAWRSTHRGPLAMYEYYRRYRWRSLPVHPLTTIAGDAVFESGLGLDGIGMYSEPADWITYEHVQSLVAALAWDSSLDAGGYLDGYLEARFGAAATAAMGRYYQLTALDPDTHGPGVLTANYGQARAALQEAAGRTKDPAPRTLLDRLTRNLDIALADMRIGLAPAGSAELDAARREYRALVHRNRFNGVCLPNMQAWGRWNGPDGQSPYDDARIRQDVVDTYASAAAGFGDPGFLVLTRGGDPVPLDVEAQDVDFAGHTVQWTATAPDGVVLEPSSGTLRVRGTRGATARVAVSATADAAAGAHRVTLEFRLADGTRLVPSPVETEIR